MEPSAFAAMFFASKHLHLITAIVCWPTEWLLSLHASSAAAGLRVRAYNPHSAPLLPAYGPTREGVLLDLQCPLYRDVIRAASDSRAFNLRFSWLLVTNESLPHWNASSALDGALILPDADVTLLAADAAADVYCIQRGQPWIVTPLLPFEAATVQHRTPLQAAAVQQLTALWASMPTAVQRRRDLRNVTIAADTVVSQPQHFKGWSNLDNRQIDTFPKLTYPLMMLVAEDLNFRYNLRQLDSYGELQPNGSFSGLCGRLGSAREELGVTSMFMRADRLHVVHYLADTVELRGAFLFLAPAQAAVSNVFLLPLSRGVWAALAMLFGAVFTLLALLLPCAAGAGNDEELGKMTPGEAFTFTVGAVCQQGHWLTPAATSWRLVMFSCIVLSLFAFTAYGATVVGILQAPSEALRTVAALASSDMRVAVQDTTYKKVYFAESNDPSTQRLFHRKLQPLGEAAYLSVVEGIRRVRGGSFAFQVEESSGYEVVSRTFTEHQKCALRHVTAFTLPMVAVPARKHSGYRDLLAARIRWQRETGLMSRWRRVWLAERPRCEAGAAGVQSVELHHVLPAHQLLWCGVVMSVLLLFAEMAAHRWGRRQLH